MREERERYFNFFSLFISFLDLWKSDRRFLSEEKAKLVYVTRATRRYQYLSVSSNFKSRKFPYLCYFEPKGYVIT